MQRHRAPGRPPLVHTAASGPSPDGGALPGRAVQRFGGDGSFAVDPAQVGLMRGGGSPLPRALLAKMQAAFGTDFTGVRVHVGPQASRIGALAFTTGNDIYFAPGQYQPDSIRGQQLLGHELAHVVQQRQGRVRAPNSGVAVVQDRALEAEADRLGMRAAAHRMPVQAKMEHGIRPPGSMMRGGRPIQRAFDVRFFNSQHLSDNSSPVKQSQANIVMGGHSYFMSEVSENYTPAVGSTLMNSKGGVNPSGNLNYVVPTGSVIYAPVFPAPVVNVLKRVKRPSSYKTLVKHHPRLPVLISTVPVHIYGIHAKSSPNVNQQLALAALIVTLYVQHDGVNDWILVGDLNFSPQDVQKRIAEIEHDIVAYEDATFNLANLRWSTVDNSTHTYGKELDFAVGTADFQAITKIGRANLRGGSDHDAMKVTYN